MTSSSARHLRLGGWWFDALVCCIGIVIFAVTAVQWVDDGQVALVPLLLGVGLIVLIARFPMVVDNRDGGIEVGFDSCVLTYLMCVVPGPDTLFIWSIGVITMQVTTRKRWSSKVFNIGIGIIAGFIASGVLALVRDGSTGTPRELLAVVLAALAYFATDYVVSAVAVAISSDTHVRHHLMQRGTLLAVACFVPFNSLGYLAAVVDRSAPPWTLSLLAVPLVTLLVAARGLTRSRENARRLTVLFDAALRAQTLSEREDVLEAVVEDARKLLYLQRLGLRAEPPGRGEIGVEVHDGETSRWLVARALERARSTVAADEQALRALAAVAADAFARLALTDEMVHVARHDPLTDLPNRGILLDRLAHVQGLSGRQDSRVALLFIDLDGFKPINDRFGHAAGDTVLVELADRLRSCVRDGDMAVRLGGDEFAVLFEDADAEVVEEVWTRILASMQAGVSVAGHRVPLSASAGIAYGGPNDEAEGLLRKADLAMYEAKARGKARVVTYEDAIGRRRIERLEMVDDLRRAVAAREIEVAYQPIVAAETGRIVGAEALARWSHGGVQVSPDLFIGIAEEIDLIVDLGGVVLDRVAADAAALRRLVRGPFFLSVNISARQLREPSFVDSVARAVEAMDGIALALEITERQGVDLDEPVLEAMRTISAMGVRFAIDDFGVGFSSISYLRNLPVQTIKADASLSRTIDTDPRASALLRSVTLMGQALGLAIVVEGIEREAQLAVLREDGKGLQAQGYLMYRPMPLADLLDEARGDQLALGLSAVS